MKLNLSPLAVFMIGFILVFSTFKSYNIIIVGENHTDGLDHKKQLEVIKDYYKYDKKIIIEMEMFQQPFQEYLDKYIQGELDLNQLVEKTEYKKRWGFDINLYKDILEFARENKIKIVALNIPSELLSEIRKKGLENIDSAYLPKPIPKHTPEEIKFIDEAMKEHKNIKNKQAFYDIQLAWDYGMAYKIYDTYKKYPDYKIIVLIGKGHANTVKRFLNVLDSGLEIFVYD
ncbi:ChaN family lipoprotein [Sulfurihydrogenibium sp.]|jgi:uncharacterized iron-regulated protein|uniref:ChaN family lipoprotein n=1 Tax=Sulfurihydrogenibium sp. TaxID=2053621 RepID=UPI002615C867|nr:ChaN family lipoprotein [Sulfurihydrogenibium sp.]